MKLLRFYFFIISFFCLSSANSQIWTQLTNVGGPVRNAAAGFSIGNFGYMGVGYTGPGMLQDFWKYDPVANTWTQVANFPGAGRFGPVSFSIGTKGYCGIGSTGYPAYNFVNDFYEYDAPSNTWTQLGNFPGPSRYTVASFVINNLAYMGTGWAPYYDDFWEYNPVTDTWLQKANFPGGPRQSAVGFSIGSNGYIGTGNNGINYSDFYKYDPVTNVWTAIANFPGIIRYGCVSFVIGNTAYVGTGGSGAYYSDFYSYDAGTNIWTAITSYPGPGVRHAVGFTIGNCGYFGTGVSSTGITNTFWKFCPCITIADILSPVHACAGSQVTFTNNSTGASSYLWEFGDGDTSTSSASTITHSYTGTGVYHVKLIGQSTCGNDTDEIILNVTNVNTNINSTNISCYGAHDGIASVTNPIPGQTYTWNPGSLHSSVISNLDSGSYTLDIVDSFGCQASLNFNITEPPQLSINITSPNTSCNSPGQASAFVAGGTPPYQYSWNTIPVSTTSSVTGLGSGTFVVNVHDMNGCIISDSLQRLAASLFQTKYYITNLHCSNVFSFYDESFGLNGHANYWLWNFGDNSFSVDSAPVHQYAIPGDYNVTLISSEDPACPDTMSYVVHVLKNPVSDFNINLDTCSFTITTENNSQFHSSSRWDFGDYWMSFDSEGSHHYLNAGNYDVKLIVSTDSTCEDTLSMHISIPKLAESIFTYTVLPCDSFVSFTNLSRDAVKYTWDFGDGDTSHLFSPDHTYSISGVVPVQLTAYSAHGCTSDLYQNIYFVTQKESEFKAAFDSCSGLVNLYDVTYGAANYLWKFGDGTTSTDYIPKLNYEKDGEFYIELIVNAGSQCADSTGRMVSNEEPLGEKVFIPNSFTPNGDGHNDIFHPNIFKPCEIYKLKIFNRWGQVVFESEDASEVFWDGSYKGDPMPNDLYVYILEGEEKTVNGYINILR